MKEKVQHKIISNMDTVNVFETKTKSTNSLNATYEINSHHKVLHINF